MDKARIRKIIIIAGVVSGALLLPLGLVVSGARGMWKERGERQAAEGGPGGAEGGSGEHSAGLARGKVNQYPVWGFTPPVASVPSRACR